MSTSPETHDVIRADDEIVTLLSGWLAYQASSSELQRRLLEVGIGGLSVEQAHAVAELLDELETAAPDARGDLEMLVRETLEAVALG